MAQRKTLEQLDVAIRRWETKLALAMTKLSKLRAQRQRLERRLHQEAPITTILGAKPLGATKPEPPAVLSTEDPIPQFLRRELSPYAPPEVRAKYEAELAIPAKEINPKVVEQIPPLSPEERKRRKAAGRIAKMKAKKAGDTTKMPLSGKAALDMIDNG